MVRPFSGHKQRRGKALTARCSRAADRSGERHRLVDRSAGQAAPGALRRQPTKRSIAVRVRPPGTGLNLLTVGVVQQAVRLAAAPDRHDQGIGDQLRGHGRTHRPADHAPGIEVDDGCHIKPALGGPDVGKIGDPLLVGRRGFEAAWRWPASLGSPRRRGRARSPSWRIRRSMRCSPVSNPSARTSCQTRRAPQMRSLPAKLERIPARRTSSSKARLLGERLSQA